jgi:hypothetical protein
MTRPPLLGPPPRILVAPLSLRLHNQLMLVCFCFFGIEVAHEKRTKTPTSCHGRAAFNP